MEDLPGVLIIGSFQSPFHGIQLLITRTRAEAEAINQDLEILTWKGMKGEMIFK